ncbi:LysR family transcriptional regulator [Marinobacter bohaiensis]|uniref:LysR family transcriptional regulator n=1 Tax=Marinobacter bohaiensis TaxID=2201898 RepID=UPI000DAD9E6B|nr:LysR family transcriptional regulator [Marinobacter bohaiensis]
MDIRQLQYLVALDEVRHFGDAAARCHVTQPALSMRLRQLEEELGLTLVTRGHRFVGFTAEGERILAWARAVLAAHDGLHAEASVCRGQLVGTLRVGMVPLAGFEPIPLLQQFAAQHADVRFELKSLSSEQILEGLDTNKLDAGFAYADGRHERKYRLLEVADTSMGLLFNRERWSFAAETLDWSDLEKLPLGILSKGMHFRQSVDHALQSAGVEITPLVETDSVEFLVQSVSAGLCCAVMPMGGGLEQRDETLELRPIAGSHTLAPLCLATRRSAPVSALAEALQQFVCERLALTDQ